tara:strand:+ start:90 stop:251 length:162 start_codon:yes stop_codon:yes gene_type:complete
MDKENLIIKVEKDIAEAEVLLKEATHELQKQQDTLFCLKAEAEKLKECINDSL